MSSVEGVSLSTGPVPVLTWDEALALMERYVIALHVSPTPVPHWYAYYDDGGWLLDEAAGSFAALPAAIGRLAQRLQNGRSRGVRPVRVVRASLPEETP
jgi:hypothetical protein